MIGTRFGLTRRMSLMLAMAPVCFLGALVASPAEARENYALIAAVSDYPNLEEKYWLKGPKNDAVLVRDYLLTSAPVPFAPENVTTLGSGEGLQLATHDAILGELGKIAKKAKAGDFIFLQFSGHGSQQPARTDLTEADGRDEIFLAADTMMAPKGDPYMPNVITDDEMAKALLDIRKTGAFVWLIFDSCHSGTITRGAPG
ncbi:MAG: caspase family protein, partial [Devosia sp.]